MRKILLFALMLSGMISSAQNSFTNGNCKAYFKYAVNDKLMSPIAGTAIDFFDKSEGSAIAWFWNFGDGNTSREQNPSYRFTYPLPATNVKMSPYRIVSLTILTSDSCKSLYSEIINIMDGNTYQPPLCKAGFKYYQVAYDVNGGTASYQLTNLSEGDSLSYFWKFDNGQTSTEKEPIVTFDIKPAEHQVCLTVTGKNNSADSFCDVVSFTDPDKPIIYPADCKTYFKYSINYEYKTLLPALVLDFHADASPEGIAWNWDFGDEITSNEQNPTHVFNLSLLQDSTLGDSNPFRKVCLTVTTVSGCMANYCETINIYMNTVPPVEPPKACTARYKYYQTAEDSIAGTVTFQFNDRSEGESLSYLWFFGNGMTSTEKEPMITFNINQLPLKASLTVTGANNCTDTFWDAVYFNEPIVYPPYEPDSTQCYTGFSYSINYDIKTFAPALTLDFHAKQTPDVIEWNWDFGDGTTSTEPNPTHGFNLPILNDSISGVFDPFRKVCLTVKTASGCVASYCEPIYIYMNTTKPGDQCHAWFKFEKATDVVSIPEVIPYKLWDVSDGKVVSWQWQFEDGSVSYEQSPIVNFGFQKPTQKVCLTILTADSCSSTWCETIYVSQMKPDTIYTGKPLDGYSMHYVSSFPIYMSSCAGYAKAQVYLNDSPVEATNYVWSTGIEGQEVKGLCPTQTYSVKATTPDGIVVTGTFVFNSDGSVTDNSINWWVSGDRDNSFINCKPANKGYTVEWQLCDGTIVKSDSIPLNSINCGDSDLNLIMRDSAGNQVYTENISMKSLVTSIGKGKLVSSVKLFPNPVSDVLNIQYSGNRLNEMQIEIFDITGKSVLLQKLNNVESGQNIDLNVSTLKRGIYLCKMYSGKQIIASEKLIK